MTLKLTSRAGAVAAAALLLAGLPLGSSARIAITQDPVDGAGTIQMTVGGETTTFDVRMEGERVATGYTTAIRGEGERLFVSLTGEPQEDSGERIFIRIVVDPATGKQYCDPMSNQVAYKPGEGENQRNMPPVETRGDCPGTGIYVESFDYDAEANRVSVAGGFEMTLRNVEGKPAATGTFEATVAPFQR